MQYWGHTYPEQLFVLYLKFLFNRVSSVLSGSPHHYPWGQSDSMGSQSVVQRGGGAAWGHCCCSRTAAREGPAKHKDAGKKYCNPSLQPAHRGVR